MAGSTARPSTSICAGSRGGVGRNRRGRRLPTTQASSRRLGGRKSAGQSLGPVLVVRDLQATVNRRCESGQRRFIYGAVAELHEEVVSEPLLVGDEAECLDRQARRSAARRRPQPGGGSGGREETEIPQARRCAEVVAEPFGVDAGRAPQPAAAQVQIGPARPGRSAP